jgi:hypothetical protein
MSTQRGPQVRSGATRGQWQTVLLESDKKVTTSTNGLVIAVFGGTEEHKQREAIATALGDEIATRGTFS